MIHDFAASPSQVGIVTRTRDNTLLLWRAMESVLDQTHANWIHIIVNDGGIRDPVERLAQRYRERYRGRLVLIHTEKPMGPEAGFNRAVAELKGTYVVLHDDDDTWERTFLEKSIEALRVQKELIPNMRGMMSWCTFVSEHLEGERIVEESAWPHNDFISGVKLYELLAKDFMPSICFMFERSVLSEMGVFDETLPRFGFREFALRFLCHYEIGVLPKFLAYYRQCSGPLPAGQQTLYSATGSYALYETHFRNEMLRRDLANGKSGLGFLLAQAGDIEFMRSQQCHHENIAQQTQGLIKAQTAPFVQRTLKAFLSPWLR